jgi:hypothetical protein
MLDAKSSIASASRVRRVVGLHAAVVTILHHLDDELAGEGRVVAESLGR